MVFEINGEIFHTTKLLRYVGSGGTVVLLTKDYSRVFIHEQNRSGGFHVHEASPAEIELLVRVEGLDVLERLPRPDR